MKQRRINIDDYSLSFKNRFSGMYFLVKQNHNIFKFSRGPGIPILRWFMRKYKKKLPNREQLCWQTMKQWQPNHLSSFCVVVLSIKHFRIVACLKAFDDKERKDFNFQVLLELETCLKNDLRFLIKLILVFPSADAHKFLFRNVMWFYE